MTAKEIYAAEREVAGSGLHVTLVKSRRELKQALLTEIEVLPPDHLWEQVRPSLVRQFISAANDGRLLR